MPSDTSGPYYSPASEQGTVVRSTFEATTGSYLDWPAVLAGGVFTLALAFLLISFGGALGLSLTSPYRGEGVSAAWLAIAAGVWFAWVMVTSLGAGGYLAGRMRRRAGDATKAEVEVRDGAHGLMVWATAVVLSSILGAMGCGGLIGNGASATGSASTLVAEAADPEYFAGVMLRGVDTPDQASAPTGAEAAPDGAPAQTDADATDGSAAGGATAAPTAGMQAGQAAEQIAIHRSVDPVVQQQIATIIIRSVASGEMVERDRSYLAQIVAASAGLGPTEARARVDDVNEEIDAARVQALAFVERTRVAGVVFGFIAAATLLIGAIAAFFAAAAGGHHRDDGLGFDVVMKRF